MSGLLQVYLEYATGDRELTVDQLVKEGYSQSYAHVLLHRLRKQGAAVASGPGRVRLLKPGERGPRRDDPEEPVWLRSLRKLFTVKETGMSVLPKRYDAAQPAELLLPPGQVAEAADLLRRNYAQLTVHEAEFATGRNVVCLYPARVRGKRASMEEALVHVYRHAPRRDFALALQALLMRQTQLNWDWLRRQAEWPELAGVFAAVNELANLRVFPTFLSAEAPDLSYVELETVAQPFTARGN